MFCGIDFGSRKAGTTAICWQEQRLHLCCCKQGQDADQFLESWVAVKQPSEIYIDAPLSLPAALYGKGDDYMFRDCDRALKAMSPMFLGGLTARAIRLKDLWQQMGIQVFEVYPGGCIRSKYSDLAILYKKDITTFLLQLQARLKTQFDRKPINWHEVDALLAWEIGARHQLRDALSAGDPTEGLIFY